MCILGSIKPKVNGSYHSALGTSEIHADCDTWRTGEAQAGQDAMDSRQLVIIWSLNRIGNFLIATKPCVGLCVRVGGELAAILCYAAPVYVKMNVFHYLIKNCVKKANHVTLLSLNVNKLFG